MVNKYELLGFMGMFISLIFGPSINQNVKTMKVTQSIFALALMMSLTIASFGQHKVFTNSDNIAVNGYDVVAYFTDYEAVRGTNEHTVSLDGVSYYFSSAENAKAFKANPSAYQPAYGGYCAFAVAMKNAKVPTDPETFKIRDGKLYLFFNDYYEGKPFNTIVPWNANEAELVDKADTNWKNLK